MRNTISFTGLLKLKLDDKINADELEYFDEIERRTSRLNSLIDDILDYSKLNTETLHLKHSSFSRILVEVLNSLNSTIVQKQAKIRLDLDSKNDEIKVSRVIQNVILNAIKFVPKDTQPKINIWQEADKAFNYLHISDNGIGMSEKNQEKIFGMFKLIANKSTYNDSWLGLTISKKIMSIHQGDLLLSSKENKGSTFTLKFSKKNGL